MAEFLHCPPEAITSVNWLYPQYKIKSVKETNKHASAPKLERSPRSLQLEKVFTQQ